MLGRIEATISNRGKFFCTTLYINLSYFILMCERECHFSCPYDLSYLLSVVVIASAVAGAAGVGAGSLPSDL